MDTTSLLEQAAAHFSNKEYTSAAECLHSVLQIDPYNADALLGMAAIYDALGREGCNKGDYKKAIIYFKKALKYDPEDEYAIKWLSKLERPVSIVIDISVRQKVKLSSTSIEIDGNKVVDSTNDERISIFCLPGQHSVTINTQSRKSEVAFFIPASKKVQYYQLDYSNGRFQFLHVLNNLSVGYSSRCEDTNTVLFEKSEAQNTSKFKKQRLLNPILISCLIIFLAIVPMIIFKKGPAPYQDSNGVPVSIEQEEKHDYPRITLDYYITYMHYRLGAELNYYGQNPGNGSFSNPNYVSFCMTDPSEIYTFTFLVDEANSEQIVTILINADFTKLEGNRSDAIEMLKKYVFHTIMLLTNSAFDDCDPQLISLFEQNVYAISDTTGKTNTDESHIDWKGFDLKQCYITNEYSTLALYTFTMGQVYQGNNNYSDTEITPVLSYLSNDGEESHISERRDDVLGAWQYYGKYKGWGGLTVLTTELPDTMLSEISSDDSLVLSIGNSYFQYYNTLYSWSNVDNRIGLFHNDYPDVLITQGEVSGIIEKEIFIANENTLYESCQGDIIVYKRIENSSISVEQANIIGEWNEIGRINESISFIHDYLNIDENSRIEEDMLNTSDVGRVPLIITETILFNPYDGTANSWQLNGNGTTINVHSVYDYWLVLIDKKTLHLIYEDGPIIVYKKVTGVY